MPTELTTQNADNRRNWTAPKLEILGSMRDVAGAKAGLSVNGVNLNRIT